MGHRPALALRRALPPMPREHGAWLVLLLPIALGLVAANSWGTPQAIVMPLAILAAFVARESLVRALRHKADAVTYAWAVALSGGAAAGGLWCAAAGRWAALGSVALVAGLLMIVHLALAAGFQRARYDRSLWGELVGVAGLTLSAPATYYAAGGADHLKVWLLWTASALFFGAGVFHVKMLLAATRARAGWRPSRRLQVGRSSLIYHTLLALLAAVHVAWTGGAAGALVAAAYAPIVLRAFYVTLRLSGQTFRFVRVGIGESVYAVWFAALYAAALMIA